VTAKVICYIEFSLYDCLEKTDQRAWKTQGISFCQICKHPVLTMTLDITVMWLLPTFGPFGFVAQN